MSQVQNYSRSRTTEVIQRPINEPIIPENNPNIALSLVQNAYGVDIMQQQLNNIEEVRNRNKVRIKTIVQKSQVQYRDEYPLITEEQEVYKYCCPICLRYFNTILVSSCCMNYMCRLCIGEMAKKAKKDSNFIIKCPHCLQNEFKLNDVKKEDKVKFYTDTPFKYTKNSRKKQTHDTNDTSNKKSEEQENPYQSAQQSPQKQYAREFDSSTQNKNRVISPSFQIHLTDISYSQPNRHSDLTILNPLGMNRQEEHMNVLQGDEDLLPSYESPFPLKEQDDENQERNNQQSLYLPINQQQIEEERKSEVYISSNSYNLNDVQDQPIVKQYSIQSIPIFKNDNKSLIDQVQNNSLSNQMFQSDRNYNRYNQSQILDNYSSQHLRKSLQSLNVKASLERIHNANLNYERKSQLQNHSLAISSQIISNIENLNINNLNSDIRRNSFSNHSNKSEEVKSTIKKQINDLQAFRNENLSPENIYIRKQQHFTQTKRMPNHMKLSGLVPIRDLLAQRLAQSDYKQTPNNQKITKSERFNLNYCGKQVILDNQVTQQKQYNHVQRNLRKLRSSYENMQSLDNRFKIDQENLVRLREVNK